MKVLHVIPSVSQRSGGPGRAIIAMCRSLREQGTEALIATTDDGMVSGSGSQVPGSGFQISSLEPNAALDANAAKANLKLETGNSKPFQDHQGIPTVVFPAEWGQSFKYSKPLAKWLDANVENFDVVHIHAVFNHACIAAASACRKHAVPYIIRPLGTLDPWSMKQKPFRKMLFWQFAGRRMLKAAAAVHYTARAEQEAAEASLGLNHGRVIPLGVEIDLPARVNGAELLSRKLPKLAGRPYVLVLSRLHPKKGLDIFVNAFISLLAGKEFRSWSLVLAGEGPVEHVRELHQLVAAGGAEDHVLFPGWLEGDEKDAVLRAAALLALPSYHENFGLCVMESLAVGVPVLVSPHVNLADAIESAQAGWIASVDSDVIKAALAEALLNETERTKRGMAGKKLAREFSCERAALQLNELYAAVAGTSGHVI
jgi:glycosyltransferase involved in cell wall biosynthesis